MSVAAGHVYDTIHDMNITPFRPETDAAFFFRAHSHTRAFEYLRKCVQEGRELAVVHGRTGMGKTMVSRMVAEDAARYGALTAYVNIVADEGNGTLRALCPSLGFTRTYVDTALFVTRIRSFAEQGNRGGLPTLLFIDNAHRLEADTLAQLLEQTRDRTAMATVLILVGLDTLEANIQQVQGERTAAVNVTIHEITPLNAAETRGYVEHYLDTAAAPIAFTAEALARIHEITNGIPKRVNGICDRLMLRATLDRITEMDAALVEEVYGATVLTSRGNSGESDVARLLHGLGLAGGPRAERPVAQPDTDDDVTAPASASAPPSAETPSDVGIAHADTRAENVETEAETETKRSESIAVTNTRRGRNLMLASAAAVVLASTAYFFNQQIRPAVTTVASAPEAHPFPIKRTLAIPAPEAENASPPVAVVVPKTPAKKATIADKSPPKSARTEVADVHKPAAKPAAVKAPKAGDESRPKPKPLAVQAPAAPAKTTKASGDKAAQTNAAATPEAPKAKKATATAAAPNKPAIAQVKKPDLDTGRVAVAGAASPVEPQPAGVTAGSDSAMGDALKAGAGDVVATAATTLASPPPIDVAPAKATADVVDQPGAIETPQRDSMRGMTQAQLDSLVLRLTSAYRQGDIDTFVGLFRDNAYTNESANAAQIRDEYAQLFELSESRSLGIEDLQWLPLGEDGLQGNGKFVAEVTLHGAQPQAFSGQLFIEVSAENGEPHIAALFHKYAKAATE